MALAVVATFALAQPTRASEMTQSSVPGAEVLVGADQPATGALAVTKLATERASVVDRRERPTADAPLSATQAAALISRCGTESFGPGGLLRRPFCDVTRAGQSVLLAGSIGTFVGAICVATAGIMCVLAAGAGAALAEYLIENGRCPGDARVAYNVSFSIRCR